MQADVQAGFDTIIRSGKQLCSLAKVLDIVSLENELPEYTKQIEQYIHGIDKERLTAIDIEKLEQVMVSHKNLATIISEKKEKISISIKQLHTGKEMQNTYPNTAL